MPEQVQLPDQRHLLAAQGWLELGNLTEAETEITHLSPELQEHPAVLEMRWQIHARAKRWDDCAQLAAALIKADPTLATGWIHRSYALHELARTAEARDGLLSVIGLFPEELTIAYNLACYECKLGNLDKAREWLGKIFSTKDSAQWKTAARADLDLKPLWPEIQKL